MSEISAELLPEQPGLEPPVQEEPPQKPAPAAAPVAPSGFVGKVSAIFATRVVILAISMLTSLLITRLLVPEQRGVYVAVVTIPAMLSALAMFGLPSAVNYFAGRGHSVASLIRASVVFTAAISALSISVAWVLLPILESSILRAAPDHLIKIMLVVVPAGILASFGGTILYGRQEVRAYNLILLLQAIGSLTGILVLVGWFRIGVDGAIATSFTVSIGTAALVALAVIRLNLRDTKGEPASLRRLVGYGLRVYPASVSGYFNYRADNNIIQAVAPTRAIAENNLGLYSWAVTMAEIVFLIPESVATMFLPRVAGLSHEQASAMLGRVARVTLLLSLLVTLALIPTAYLGVHLVLPRYVDSLPAFLAILPGVVALSLAKVMTSYLGGRGRPGPASVGATIALIVNVPLNVALIPVLGIVGASLSSVVSYGILAALVTWMAARTSGQPLTSLFVPRRADFELLANGTRNLLRHSFGLLRSRSARAGG